MILLLLACLIPVEIPIYIPVDPADTGPDTGPPPEDLDTGAGAFAPTALHLGLRTGLDGGAPISAWTSATAEGQAEAPTLTVALSGDDRACAWEGPFTAGVTSLTGADFGAFTVHAGLDGACANAQIAGWDSVDALFTSGQLVLGLGPLPDDTASGRDDGGLFGLYVALAGAAPALASPATALLLDPDATLAVDEAGSPLAALAGEGGFEGAVFVRAEPVEPTDAAVLSP